MRKLACCCKALALYEQDNNRDKSGIGIVLNNLGKRSSAIAHYAEAEDFYELVFSNSRKGRHPQRGNGYGAIERSRQSGRTHANLASLLKGQGHLADADIHAKKALEIREEYLGKEHPDVAASLSQLGDIAKARGEYSQAEAPYALAAAFRSKFYPSGDIHLANNLLEAAMIHWQHGRLDAADVAYREAEAMYGSHYGGDPIFLASLWESHGELAVARGKPEEAEPLLKDARPLREDLPRHAVSCLRSCRSPISMPTAETLNRPKSEPKRPAKSMSASTELSIAIIAISSRGRRPRTWRWTLWRRPCQVRTTAQDLGEGRTRQSVPVTACCKTLRGSTCWRARRPPRWTRSIAACAGRKVL